MQELKEEERSMIFKMIDSFLTKKKFKNFFNKNLTWLLGIRKAVVWDSFPFIKLCERLQNFELLTEKNREHFFALLDAFLRDAKTKKAYAS